MIFDVLQIRITVLVNVKMYVWTLQQSLIIEKKIENKKKRKKKENIKKKKWKTRKHAYTSTIRSAWLVSMHLKIEIDHQFIYNASNVSFWDSS
jgi:hypothetical protein